eukprot:jgi/Mesvir1/2275/Mv19316-RA.1
MGFLSRLTKKLGSSPVVRAYLPYGLLAVSALLLALVAVSVVHVEIMRVDVTQYSGDGLWDTAALADGVISTAQVRAIRASLAAQVFNSLSDADGGYTASKASPDKSLYAGDEGGGRVVSTVVVTTSPGPDGSSGGGANEEPVAGGSGQSITVDRIETVESSAARVDEDRAGGSDGGSGSRRGDGAGPSEDLRGGGGEASGGGGGGGDGADGISASKGSDLSPSDKNEEAAFSISATVEADYADTELWMDASGHWPIPIQPVGFTPSMCVTRYDRLTNLAKQARKQAAAATASGEGGASSLEGSAAAAPPVTNPADDAIVRRFEASIDKHIKEKLAGGADGGTPEVAAPGATEGGEPKEEEKVTGLKSLLPAFLRGGKKKKAGAKAAGGKDKAAAGKKVAAAAAAAAAAANTAASEPETAAAAVDPTAAAEAAEAAAAAATAAAAAARAVAAAQAKRVVAATRRQVIAAKRQAKAATTPAVTAQKVKGVALQKTPSPHKGPAPTKGAAVAGAVKPVADAGSGKPHPGPASNAKAAAVPASKAPPAHKKGPTPVTASTAAKPKGGAATLAVHPTKPTKPVPKQAPKLVFKQPAKQVPKQAPKFAVRPKPFVAAVAGKQPGTKTALATASPKQKSQGLGAPAGWYGGFSPPTAGAKKVGGPAGKPAGGAGARAPAAAAAAARGKKGNRALLGVAVSAVEDVVGQDLLAGTTGQEAPELERPWVSGTGARPFAHRRQLLGTAFPQRSRWGRKPAVRARVDPSAAKGPLAAAMWRKEAKRESKRLKHLWVVNAFREPAHDEGQVARILGALRHRGADCTLGNAGSICSQAQGALRDMGLRAGSLGSCAVVGTDGELKLDAKGRHIDAHDTVIRMGNTPTKGFESIVGRKTTLMHVWAAKLGKLGAGKRGAPRGSAGSQRMQAGLGGTTEDVVLDGGLWEAIGMVDKPSMFYVFDGSASTLAEVSGTLNDRPYVRVDALASDSHAAAKQIYSWLAPEHTTLAHGANMTSLEPSHGLSLVVSLLRSGLCSQLDLYGFPRQASPLGFYFDPNGGNVFTELTHVGGLELYVYRVAMANGLLCMY